METLIRLLLKGQSDQVLHCLRFSLYFYKHLSVVKFLCSNFRVITEKKKFGVRKFRKITLLSRQ